jgi:hypothetical protein
MSTLQLCFELQDEEAHRLVIKADLLEGDFSPQEELGPAPLLTVSSRF